MESLKDECTKYRLDFDRLQIADPAHEAQCSSCRVWTAQTQSILDVAAAMPQFDVSEALTQRILESVEAEAKRPRVEFGLLLPAAFAAGVALFTMAPVESVEGMLSWAIGLAGVVLLKAIVEMAPGVVEQTG